MIDTAGANKVIPAELEAALQITSLLMTRTCAYDTAEIDRLTAEIRKAHE